MKKSKRMMMSALTGAIALGSVLGAATVNAEDRVQTLLEGMTLEQKITQMLMPDFRQWKQEGETKNKDMTVLSDEVADIIDKYDFGGVILFANNVKETKQTLKLTTDMQSAAITNQHGNGNIPLLLTIDQEGGIVYRLGSGTALPGNMALGATGNTKSSQLAGEVIGRELNALGINVNFSPVMDVNNNPNNPVIGLRSFSSDPQLVAKLATSMMKGIQTSNVATAAKHFPGHGDTATDSHTGLPLVNKSYQELKDLELIPFQEAVNNGVDMLMTAHIQYPQIEKDTVISKKDGSEIYIPATLSDDILTGVVRNDMGFKGIVVTDAMNMTAISENFGEAEAVIMAIDAGVDICLMPTILRSKADVQKLDDIINSVKQAITDGKLTEARLNESVLRILKLKEKRGVLDYASDTSTFEQKLDKALKEVGSKENRAIEREIAAQAVTVTKNENNILPFKPQANQKVLLVGAWPNEQPGMELSMRRLIAEGVIPQSVTYESVNYCIWNGYGGISLDEIKAKVDTADYVVVISEIENASQMDPTANGDWESYYPTEIIKYANSKNVAATIMSIAKPYDVSNYPDAKAAVAVYGTAGMDPTEGLAPSTAFGPNIPAGIEVIFGGHEASGKLPVDIPVVKNSVLTDEVAYPIGFGLTYSAVDIADKTALSELIEKMEKVENENYTKETWTAFQDAIQAAKTVLDNKKATQAEVDEMVETLNKAYAALKTEEKPTTPDPEGNGDGDSEGNGGKQPGGVTTSDTTVILPIAGLLLLSGAGLVTLKRRKQKN